MTKVCSKCNVEKSLDEYHKAKGKGKRIAICKVCKNAYAKEYRLKNIDALREKDKIRNNTPEAIARRKEQNKQYWKKNREHLKAKKKEHYYKNRESILKKKYDKRAMTRVNRPELNIYSNGELTIKSPTHGDHTVLYDPEDEQLLKQHKWRLARCGENGQKERAFYVRAHIPCPSGEWVVWGGVNRRKLIGISMHRLVNDTPKDKVTDHINGNTLDNRKFNLMSVDQSGNMRNKGKMARNTSGYIGVCWCKKSTKWQASVHGNINKVQTTRWSTLFSDKIEAAVARDKALCSLFDVVSPERQLNFPERYEEYMTGKDIWLEEFEKVKAARAMTRRNKLGFIGVRACGKGYSARITSLGKETHLGHFATPELAAEAFDRKACEYDFLYKPKKKRNLNFPERYDEYKADIEKITEKKFESSGPSR